MPPEPPVAETPPPAAATEREVAPAPPAPETVRGKATTADILGKVVERLESQAVQARGRLKDRGTTFGSGPLHEIPNIRDYAIIGAAKIARGVQEFGAWSGEMVKEFGEKIKPHLESLFSRSQALFDDHASVVTRVNRVLYEAGLPRRSIASAGKKAVGKAIEAGVEAGSNLTAAEVAPKLADLQDKLSDSIPTKSGYGRTEVGR